ncbi:sulfatase-like hydrolase/transferase [Candidatus Neptunochlamydia vexilliferae]|uniref:Sulfatase N-terminal domain-containing protein n=1 Tax=Candidatus Neptunichlamydia vexilliferae TaxID=1651774 RepID=A0ABS0AYJ3_9BACT|nr:sulfatase-like hydrolase/transferase [Candidatus Neptunochlamydia vexilliferae]MBF5059209.1 hypothetical protein [Candidatus Neptunochlamydia vexilliferae]
MLSLLFARLFIRRDFSILGILQELGAAMQLALVPWLAPALELLVLYDAYIDKKMGFRLGSGSFPLLFQLGEFKDSAKAIGIFRVLPLFLGVTALSLFFHPFTPWLLVLGLVPAQKESLILIWEKELFQKLFKPKKKNFLPFIKRELLSKNEISSAPSIDYPLLRYTAGFKGERTFNIRLEPGEKPHVIFLFFESLRAKDFREEVTPNLCALAKKSHVFSNFYSNSVLTFRAFYTALYGLPYSLGTKTGLELNLPTVGLPELFHERGYETNFFTGASWSLGGVDHFLKRRAVTRVIDKKDFSSEALGSSWGIEDGYLLNGVADHLERHQEVPQFYTLFTITSHHPWQVPKSYKGPNFEEVGGEYYPQYLQTLHYTDGCVGHFIGELKRRGVLKNTLLFIMGDHGMVVEDGAYEYNRGNRKENFHVPLLIYGEGKIETPQKSDVLASQCDLLPTVMDLFGWQGYQHGIGRSLLRKEREPRIFYHNPSYLEADLCTRKEDEVLEGKAPVLDAFREMIGGLYRGKRLAPPSFDKKDPPLALMFTAYDDQKIDDAILSKVSPEVTTFHLTNSYRVTDAGMETLLKRCPALIEINVSGCLLLTDKWLYALPQTLHELNVSGFDLETLDAPIKGLHTLNIQETPIKSLKKLPKLFPYLSCLYLSYTHLTAEGIREVIDALPLSKLDLVDCEGLTDEEAFTLFAPHPTLRFLKLTNCAQLTDHLFTQIEETSLRHLRLTSVPHLTNRGLEALLKLPLDVLRVSGCPNLTAESPAIVHKYADAFVDLSVHQYVMTAQKKMAGKKESV